MAKPDPTPEPEPDDSEPDETAQKVRLQGWMREAWDGWLEDLIANAPDDDDDEPEPDPIPAPKKTAKRIGLPPTPPRAKAPRPSGGSILDVLIGR